MARAGNFSVPGAGKTAMLLGVFAFLNRNNAPDSEKVKRMLVVAPLNAFDSWKREFKLVFGSKKQLKFIDSQNTKDFKYQLKTEWGISNLVLVNYESLPSYADELAKLVGPETMLIFDEVHRIKNPEGQRASAALEISQGPSFKYVLTGTPIPNSYQDVYNFLHILYGNEYNAFFGWEPSKLANPKRREIEEINEKLFPFYWRTNKDDLNVPKPDEDIREIVSPSEEQLDLVEQIYNHEQFALAAMIRTIQASTNPSLVNQSINYQELVGSYSDSQGIESISEERFDKLVGKGELTSLPEEKYQLSENITSPKFNKGIELVTRLVHEGKKVLVWGIFVDTLHKIEKALEENGIKVNLVYGATDKPLRRGMIDDFRDRDVQVLVSNPQTLGESISLHQSVHDAVYFEYDFNLTFMLQSRDRIHRLGLDPNQYTRYYYLQTAKEDVDSDRPGFIDEQIYSRLKDKEEIMYNAVDSNELSIDYDDDEIEDAIKIIDAERKRIKDNHG